MTQHYIGIGDEVARFSAGYIRQTKGQWFGQQLVMEPWQRRFLDELYLSDAEGNYVYREALLGLPRKNGKSTLAAVIALHGLLDWNEPGGEIYAAAAARDQARIVFDQAKAFVEASPRLRDWLRPQRNAIICDATGSTFKVLSSDAPLQHGLNPSLVIIDELHAHKDPELYYALTTGQLARKNPLVVSITTAGYDLESICRAVYDRGMEIGDGGGLDAMRAEGFLMQWFGAADDDDPSDPAVWEAANPSSWITAELLAYEFRRLPSNIFRRLHLNQWTESEEAWLAAASWDRLRDREMEIPAGWPGWLGVDVGTKHDSSAIVFVGDKLDSGPWAGRHPVKSKIFRPRGDGTKLDLARLEDEIRRAREGKTFGDVLVRGVVYDRWSFERSAQTLSDEGFLMDEEPMSNERMTQNSMNLYDGIVNERELVHDGDKELRAHVLAGSTKQHERGWRLVKQTAKRPIDALIGLCLGYSRARERKSVYEDRGLLTIGGSS